MARFPFTAEEGADRYCEPLGCALRDTRVFDWSAAISDGQSVAPAESE